MNTTPEYLGSASYDPADNKLRFRPDARLSKPDYERARAAGFIWAPKQELFVAPMWTPDREDLLLEWCGEIGDEDTSLVQRAAERAERFEDYSENRKQDAESARSAVSAIADNIPLGQPILVGHHSERRARKDAERIENGMRKAIKMWDQSQYWQQRAKGAIRHAKYKERPDVRARRIKGIEADKRKQERNKADAEQALRFWSGEMQLVHRSTGEKFKLEIIEANREQIRAILGGVLGNVVGDFNVAPKENGSPWEGWSAWNVLEADATRYKACPSCTVEQCREAAEKAFPARIAQYDRWITHYENRLCYERAMLESDGGTATAKTGPEKGGAVKCWVKRGGWCEIVKVNKVSVSVADNWGNGGPDFLRTVPFDKLTAVISRAEWQAMKQPGKTEVQIEAERLAAFDAAHAAELDAMSYGRKFRELGANDRDIIRAALRVKLGESIPENNGTPIPEKPSVPNTYKAPARTVFDDMRDTLKAGVQVVSAPQLFPTPPELARRVVELADIHAGYRVLEPSCGTGNLLAAIKERFGGRDISECGALEIVAVEINTKLAGIGTRLYASRVICGDFLERNGDLGTFDRIVMNPPFADGADIKHITHALTFLNPGGRLVAICANGPRQQATLKPQAEQWIELEDAFAEAGTNVRTAIAVFTR